MGKNEKMKFYNLYTPWIDRKPLWKEILLKIFKPKEYKNYKKILKKQSLEREHFIKQLNKNAQEAYKNYVKTLSK